jgi:hypothetical protein
MTLPKAQSNRPHIYTHTYAGLVSKEIHKLALERVAHYSEPPPDKLLETEYKLCRQAWEWAAKKHSPK